LGKIRDIMKGEINYSDKIDHEQNKGRPERLKRRKMRERRREDSSNITRKSTRKTAIRR